MYTNWTDTEVTNFWKLKAERLSFFNAADGEVIRQEREQRRKAYDEFTLIEAERKSRNLDKPEGNYLI